MASTSEKELKDQSKGRECSHTQDDLEFGSEREGRQSRSVSFDDGNQKVHITDPEIDVGKLKPITGRAPTPMPSKTDMKVQEVEDSDEGSVHTSPSQNSLKSVPSNTGTNIRGCEDTFTATSMKTPPDTIVMRITVDSSCPVNQILNPFKNEDRVDDEALIQARGEGEAVTVDDAFLKSEVARLEMEEHGNNVNAIKEALQIEDEVKMPTTEVSNDLEVVGEVQNSSSGAGGTISPKKRHEFCQCTDHTDMADPGMQTVVDAACELE